MTYTLPRNLAWHVLEDRFSDELVIYLMRLPDGKPEVLQGMGALIWAAAMEQQDPVEVVIEATGEPREAVEESILAFVDQLLADDLLILEG